MRGIRVTFTPGPLPAAIATAAAASAEPVIIDFTKVNAMHSTMMTYNTTNRYLYFYMNLECPDTFHEIYTRHLPSFLSNPSSIGC